MRPDVGIPSMTREVLRWLEGECISISPIEISGDVWDTYVCDREYRYSYSTRWYFPVHARTSVLTIHDCREIEHPYWSPHRGSILRDRIRQHWSDGGIIHTFSECVATCIRERVGEEGPLYAARLDPKIEYVSTKSLSRPKIVLVGSEALHKGHEFVLNCWRRLRLKDADFVLIGPRSSASECLDRHPAIRNQNVLRLGNVSKSVKLELISTAQAIVAPSRHEGLGLVVIEALQLGVPVIASDIPAHREVAAGWATLLDPYDTDAWIDAMRMGICGEFRFPGPFEPKRDYARWRAIFDT